MAKHTCPTCGRKMKQQFIGLHHCKCGTSVLRGHAFQRTSDMVFCLRRVKVGKKQKTKQIPYIRYNSAEPNPAE